MDKGFWGHKYRYGHAMVVVGGVGRGGAGRLAARGALRVGAGLVTVGCPGAALPENAARLDAVMVSVVDSPSDLAGFFSDPRVNALCLGPGLGVDRAEELLPAALEWGGATVLDADALTAFAGDPARGLSRLLHKRCLLTPHEGEFRRLFPDLLPVERGAASGERTPEPLRGEAARTAARRAGCTVLLKGPVSWIAPADGEPERIEAPADGSAGWLATAGSGDVLAGFCAGLMARGMSPSSAAGTAVRWHFECGRLAGPGLIAEDLPEVLPRVLRRLFHRPSLAASPVGGRDGGDPRAKPPGAHPGAHEGPGPAGQGAAA